MYEFKGLEIPPHKCNVLEPVKVSPTRTHLICVLCKQIIGTWDDVTTNKSYPEDSQYYTEKNLDKWK